MRVGERKEVGGQSEGKSAVPGPVILYNPEQRCFFSVQEAGEQTLRVWVTKASVPTPDKLTLESFSHGFWVECPCVPAFPGLSQFTPLFLSLSYCGLNVC